MMRVKKILFLYSNYSSFVKTDHKILSKKYKVTRYKFISSKNIFKMFTEQLKLKFFLLINIWKYDVLYCWFADYHSFLPVLFAKIFGKRSILILGGYDVTYIPKINYGSFNNPIRKFFTKNSIKHADRLLAVSKYVKDEILKRVKSIQVEVLYLGFSSEKFTNKNQIRKYVLTVATTTMKKHIKLKGIDTFIKLANELPEQEFMLIGVSEKIESLLKPIPKNLHVINFVEQKKLLEYYNLSKIYCQFSLIESFGSALAEAMLCGCIGVAYNVGALKEVIGENGSIIENKNFEEAKQMISKLFKGDVKEIDPRSQIVNKFPLKKRKDKLIAIIEEVCDG